MGTVDMRGGYGTYTLFSDRPVERDDPKGDVQGVSVQDFDLDGTPDTVEASLKGPPDLFHLQPGALPGPGDYLTTRVTVQLDPETDTAVLRAGDDTVLLREGEWSDWVPVSFEALPLGLATLHGAVRFLAMELRPAFKLYASPVNLSAASPPQVVTSPEDWIGELYAAPRPVLHPGHARGDQCPARRRLQRRRLPAAGRPRAARLARDARARPGPLPAGRRALRLPLGHRPPVPHAVAPRGSRSTPASATRRATRRSRPPTPTTSSASTPTSTRCSGACASGCRRRRC